MIQLDYEKLFSAVDSGDAPGFGQFLTEDAEFRFGNAPSIFGREAIVAYVDGFFASIGGSAHTTEDVWQAGDRFICTGQVNYLRHDGTELAVPFANVLYLRDSCIARYLIFIDNSSLYSAGQSVIP